MIVMTQLPTKKHVNAADLNIRTCSECGSKLRGKEEGVCGRCLNPVPKEDNAI